MNRAIRSRLAMTVPFLGFLFVLPLTAYSQENSADTSRLTVAWSFPTTLSRILALPHDVERKQATLDIIASQRKTRVLLTVDSAVYFLYSGSARHVFVAGDFNEWNPTSDSMARIPGTDCFYACMKFSPSARIEYKFVVDSNWILDPLNFRLATGGFGTNSEARLPEYRPPGDVLVRENIPHGRIDTLVMHSRVLGYSHPVFVYTPPGSEAMRDLPAIIVADGGEYLERANMNIVLDNLLADHRICPVVAVFVDPRVDLMDPQSTRRMSEYALSDTFLTFLTEELLPMLRPKYHFTQYPGQTAILGASLGGLLSTYAAFHRPDVFGLCAAQSPAYQIRHGEIYTMVPKNGHDRVRFYLETGTVHDAELQARTMKELLLGTGYRVRYVEVPESHNWMNWRAHLADLLTFFWGTP